MKYPRTCYRNRVPAGCFRYLLALRLDGFPSTLDCPQTSLSRLVATIKDGKESEIIIIRGGRPVARLLPMESTPKKRIGVAEGKFTVPDDIDLQSANIACHFHGED